MGDINPNYFSIQDIKDYLAYMDGDYIRTMGDSVLSEDLPKSYEPTEGRPHHIALLFYAYDSDNSKLNLWVINKNGVHSSGSSAIDAAGLITLERQFYLHLKKQSSAQVQRGVMLEDTEEPELPKQVDSILASVLFPGETAHAIRSYSSLLISPVLNIGTLPWYCIKPEGQGDQMIDHWNVQILESLNHLSIVARMDLYGDKQYKNKVLGYQPNFYEHERSTFSPFKPLIIGNPNYGNCGLPALEGAEDEAEYVANALATIVLSGDKAVLDSLTTPGKDDWYGRNRYLGYGTYFRGDLLYFATHAISSSTAPMDSSFIYLSSEKDECIALSAKEVLNIKKLPGSLIIMSACESGKGRTVTGGVVGLARSFLINGDNEGYGNSFYGARNVVMSLWSIDDQSTTELMKIFVNELQKEQSYWPVSPLRQAILKYRALDSDPLHWGAFQSMGLAYPGTLLVRMEGP